MFDLLPGEYYADEHKALLRILDEFVRTKDFHTKNRIDQLQIAAHGTDFVDHLKKQMIHELSDIIAREFLEMDLIKFRQEEEYHSGMVVMQAEAKFSFLKDPDQFRLHMEEAIKELTEYEDL